MSPSRIRRRVAGDRIAWVDRMLAAIRDRPLDDRETFMADERNIWAAESCLRRALEALFDLGRHVAVKGFGRGVSEYREIARELASEGVIGPSEAERMERMAGYRNRMVHFYHDVDPTELYSICTEHLDEVEQLAHAIRDWLRSHPELLDETL